MLIAESVSKVYRSGDRPLTVVRDVSFGIVRGEFVAIVGPSGSGKTTLLGLLAGLDTPTEGRVILDGRDLSVLSEDARARLRGEDVGFVFQNFQLIPTLTALENVQVPMELRGSVPSRNGSTNHATPRARAEELLLRVGLADRGDHFPTQLSGGEQQRVALARAFANEPAILFADEPTGNLDATNGKLVVDLLSSLNRDAGTTIVMVTHDAEIASRASRVIRIADGAIVEDSLLAG